MFQFWRRLAKPLTQHPVGRAVVDHPLFREQNYHTLSRQDAARRADLGTYRAESSTQSQSADRHRAFVICRRLEQQFGHVLVPVIQAIATGT
jgi:hypothetical protein